MAIAVERPTSVVPPATLYHGTAWARLPAILAEGLVPTGEPYVRLWADAATAVNVASRYGCAFVLAIAAERMHREGHEFVSTTDGLWLTGHVPPAYLRQIDLDGRT